MMRIALFFADGQAYFFGLAIIAAAALIAQRFRHNVWMHGLTIAGIAGVILSSTPAPHWLYALLAVALVAGLCLSSVRVPRAYRLVSMAAVVITCMVAAVCELRHRTLPVLESHPGYSVYIVGDSLSAGVRRGEVTWPKVLQNEGFAIHDLSQAGATVQTAMSQARQIEHGPATVILEIGGNDLLGKTSRREFETGLERLLQSLTQDGRRVVMFELPLPPFAHAYGWIQRDLATRFGVPLIPKRVLAGVLGMQAGTIDGLHLSASGHRSIATTVGTMLGNNQR